MSDYDAELKRMNERAHAEVQKSFVTTQVF